MSGAPDIGTGIGNEPWSTSLGASTIALPRARIEGEDGRRHEWRSEVIPRYQGRTERVDEAVLGVYLSDQHPASLPNEEPVLLLLFGLLRSGQIKLRRLVGWQQLGSSSKSAEAA